MARIDQHGAYAFLLYYLIWIIFFRTDSLIIPSPLMFLVILFGICPDFDGIYYAFKHRDQEKIDTQFQHHLHYWTHWPLTYVPLIPIFIVSLIFDFYPEYFLAPVVGIYLGHFLFDSISSGDGIMWGKIPWRKNQYARFINFFPGNCDGYHGIYWAIRYQETTFCRLGNAAVIASIGIIASFQAIGIFLCLPHSLGLNGYYIVPLIFFFVRYRIHTVPRKYLRKSGPPKNRYADYRIDPHYINGLNARNRTKHFEKYRSLLNQNMSPLAWSSSKTI